MNRKFEICNVGDGLCFSFLKNRVCTRVDWGGTDAKQTFEASTKLQNPNYFIISHFHKDHYNGLLYAYKVKQKLFLEKVIFPLIPEFEEKTLLQAAFFVSNLCSIGSTSGSIEFDFIDIILKLNVRKCQFRGVSRGDKLRFGDFEINILWPPKVLNKKKLPNIIKKSLLKYKTELKTNSDFYEIHNYVINKINS